jgi:N-acetylmuramoyl-L-alanine amidase
VIDPGHGGKDPGNLGTGRYKITEKHIALAISLKLGEYIKSAFPDIKILYTRTTNEEFLELWERTQLANNNNADLFISVHCDAFTNSNAYGAGVFVMGMSKLKANMDIAMKENSVIYLEDDYQQNYDGFDPNTPESYIVFSLTQNTYLDQSLKIAEKVEHEFDTRANRKSRGVKQAPFYVISRANMPSILIEAGFLTNPKEEDYLHSKIGQVYLSSAIFRAFKSYKEEIEGIESLSDNKEDNLIEKRTKFPEVEKDVEEENEVVFKIQIGTYLKPMVNDPIFDGLKVEEIKVNGTYKYLTFTCSNKLKADKEKIKLRSDGFSGAFIIAFYNGKQISVKEALDLQNNK